MMSGPLPAGKPTIRAPAATDRLARSQSASRPAARQRPRPDAEIAGGEVSFEPPSRFTSLDHLVGAQQERLGDCQPERLGGCKIDDEIELGCLLDRNFARLRP